MIQIVIINSALGQNWVGCTVCTPWTLTASVLHPGRTHAVSWAPCRGVQGVVSWPPSFRVAGASYRVSQRTHVLARGVIVPLIAIQKLYCNAEPMQRAQRRVAASTGRVARCAKRRVVAPRSRYKICIATKLPTPRIVRRVARAVPSAVSSPPGHDIKFVSQQNSFPLALHVM